MRFTSSLALHEFAKPFLFAVSQSVKEILQSLVDDDLVCYDKIGSANFYWSFPSQALITVRTIIPCNILHSLALTPHTIFFSLQRNNRIAKLTEERETYKRKVQTTEEAVAASLVGKEQSVSSRSLWFCMITDCCE